MEGISAVRVVKLLRNFKELCREHSEHSVSAVGAVGGRGGDMWAADKGGQKTRGVANKYKKK